MAVEDAGGATSSGWCGGEEGAGGGTVEAAEAAAAVGAVPGRGGSAGELMESRQEAKFLVDLLKIRQERYLSFMVFELKTIKPCECFLPMKVVFEVEASERKRPFLSRQQAKTSKSYRPKR